MDVDRKFRSAPPDCRGICKLGHQDGPVEAQDNIGSEALLAAKSPLTRPKSRRESVCKHVLVPGQPLIQDDSKISS